MFKSSVAISHGYQCILSPMSTENMANNAVTFKSRLNLHLSSVSVPLRFEPFPAKPRTQIEKKNESESASTFADFLIKYIIS